MLPRASILDNNPIAKFVPVSTGCLSLIIYLATIRPEIDWGDSAELSLQAYQLGVTHPPGYPIHTLLGRFFILFFPKDPAFATNLMSAVFTSLAVYLLSVIVLKITDNWSASLLGGLIFASLPNVWQMAVTTEVYNVNIGIVALAFFLILLWHRTSSKIMLYLAALTLGISMGSYFANLLLLPAFIILVWDRKHNNRANVVLFLLIVFVTGSLISSWSYFRAAVVSPVGTEFIPNSFNGFMLFITGAQYKPLSLHSSGFYYHRIIDHTQIFIGNVTWLGVGLGLWGVVNLWKEHRTVCLGLILIFIAVMGYFTGYSASDYYTMVTPAYFVFSLWMAWGIYFLTRRLRFAKVKFFTTFIPPVLLITLIYPQIGVRFTRSQNTPVTDFVLSSFEALPNDAIVVAHWKQFTPLLFFQETQGLRPDLTIIERQNAPRHYSFGTIKSWTSPSYTVAASRPLWVYGLDDTVKITNQFQPIGNGWYKLISRPPLSQSFDQTLCPSVHTVSDDEIDLLCTMQTD